MQEELVNIPMVMAAQQDILKERVSNIQRQQGKESQLGDMGSSKKWKRLKGKKNAIILREGFQQVSKAIKGK